ncbi:hypothetical protein PFY10_09280 [Chryseobacterium daecheongense]|nr:hypothetical protein PFY10_09280 [Chryseobacterium daecheongense]
MIIFNREEYAAAIAAWDTSSKDYSTIKKLIPPNYVFTLSFDQIDWLKKNNKCDDFCSEIGVYKNQLVLILCPLDVNGQKIAVNEYPYSVLAELTSNLTLVETKEYTLVKNAVLSKELQQVDKTADMYLPVANMPIMEQDKAVAAIELWRDEGSTWFYRECDEFKGARIFKRFYVPVEDLCPSKEGLSYIICSFGIKFSEIYQRPLVTLIFISFYKDLQNTGSVEVISNTYDWSRPCPPICQL